MIIGLDLYAALKPMLQANNQPQISPKILQMLGSSQTIVIVGRTHAAATLTMEDPMYWHTPEIVINHLIYLVEVLKTHGHTVKSISLSIWSGFANSDSIREVNKALTGLHALSPSLRNTPLRIYSHGEATMNKPTMFEDALIDWLWTNNWEAIEAAREANIATNCPQS